MKHGNRVFVLNMRGEALMPTTQRKARILLRDEKAKIAFTIQLNYPTGENRQNVSIGVDTGARHIGIAVTSEDKVLYKAEVMLRQDISSNLDTKRIYRRGRRNRKTRYRKSSAGDLPPSLQSRTDAHFRWIDTFRNLVADAELHIEVGKFDAAKMINPGIQGEEYQHGQASGFYDVRYFVFARDAGLWQI